MTKEEALEILNGFKLWIAKECELREALDMAIESLSESNVHNLHSGDLISRKAAIDALRVMQTYKLGVGDDILLINQAEAQTELMLLSPQPERKNGHWVEIGHEPYDEWECDMCGFFIDGSGCIDPEEYKDIYKFCQNCGADMRGNDE